MEIWVIFRSALLGVLVLLFRGGHSLKGLFKRETRQHPFAHALGRDHRDGDGGHLFSSAVPG